MQLTVLGCWGPYPRAGGACSGYLIRDGGRSILLEAGSGCLSKLMNYIDYNLLDAVIVTHLHHDHYLDLFPLRHAVEGARRAGRRHASLKLYIPSLPANEFSLLDSYKNAFEIVAIESLPVEIIKGGHNSRRMDIGGLPVCFVATKHSLPGYSVSFGDKDRMVFSGDTARTDGLTALAEGAGLFLCEASGLDRDAGYLQDIHMTARQAGEVAEAACAKQLLITHFWPEYDLDELSAQAKSGWGRQVTPVREGETYST
ncbi:MAG: ribonuclease Z [Pelotomaculum sp. PtaB.Bin104]|nr:MAG: ribonuclease Z [Pelotomaculum sp. PtaB.Bin104]